MLCFAADGAADADISCHALPRLLLMRCYFLLRLFAADAIFAAAALML